MIKLYDLRRDRYGRACLVDVGKVGQPGKVEKITSAAMVYDMCCLEFEMNYLAEEVVYMFATNVKTVVTGVFMLSKGTVCASLIDTREIFVRALLLGASRILLAHNHPSGDPSPSREDIGITERVKKAGELLSVELLDHIVVGECSYYSFKENA